MPDSDATDDLGDRQPEMDAIMARNEQSSFEDRAGVTAQRLDDLPEAQREEARKPGVSLVRSRPCAP